MKLLEDAIRAGAFLLDVEASDMPSILQRTISLLVDQDLLSADRQNEVVAALLEREEEMSTAIGHSVAVPHAYLDALTAPCVVFVQLARPVNLGAPDGIPTRFLVVLLGPIGAAAEHLDALTTIARLMSDDEFRYEAGASRNQQDLLGALRRFQVRTSAPAAIPGAAAREELRYTGRLCGGLLDDIRRRLPHYTSDFRDGLHPKCIASTLFLFFACMAPAVTFGGILADLSDNYIGAIEMIAASALCGIIFALLSGQPLIILGGTGPLLIFTVILYRLCKDLLGLGDLFLEVRVWVGFWTALFLVILAVTDASCLMRFFTRFTDEIFAALISLIFVFEAIKGTLNSFRDLDVGKHHDTALLSLLLALGTFYVAMSLSRIRRSRYLTHGTREFLTDFGPTIALTLMTVLAMTSWMRDVPLTRLPTPSSFRPTYSVPPDPTSASTDSQPAPETPMADSTQTRETASPDTGKPRRWLVNPFLAPVWVWFAAAGPALLLTVLVFVDQNITARLINNADHKLQKGGAYHLDLAVAGLLVGLCPLFGFPWLIAATVRSLNHVRSLATVEEVVTPGGETREQIIHVRENRVTGLAIHLLIGLSLFLLPYLNRIPMAVLYGLFLFMGVVSMAGNQFFERLSLWLMDSKLYPATHYIRRAPLSAIHKFTLLQLVCLIVLWVVKESPLGILFPLFIALLVPVRLLAGRFFADEHLEALDAEEQPREEEWD
jgi:mannitol/fructose-specific phosphotransferase system IIA component (Ntr-type)